MMYLKEGYASFVVDPFFFAPRAFWHVTPLLQAIRINEAHADCVKDIEERYRKLMDAESELKAQKDESDALKLRKDEIDQRW